MSGLGFGDSGNLVRLRTWSCSTVALLFLALAGGQGWQTMSFSNQPINSWRIIHRTQLEERHAAQIIRRSQVTHVPNHAHLLLGTDVSACFRRSLPTMFFGPYFFLSSFYAAWPLVVHPLSSPQSVIQFLGAFFREGAVTIVTEYMDGGSLLNVLQQAR